MIVVLTLQLLKNMLQKPNVSGRFAYIAIELSEFDIHFKPLLAIKGKIVSDFITNGIKGE